MASTDTVTITASNFDEEVTRSEVPVLVDFWASWCGPCKMIAPVLDEIAREKAGVAKVAKVNIQESGNEALAARFGVQYLPSMLYFKDGEVRETIVGLKSKKELVDKLDALSR